MKATLLILCLLLAGAMFAIGAASPEDEPEQPVDPNASAGTGETLATDDEDGLMLVGEIRRRSGQWFIDTQDETVEIIIPDAMKLAQLTCKLNDRDEVIIRGKFADTRFLVQSLEKNGVKYDFTD